MLIQFLHGFLYFVAAVLLVYMLRHYIFTFNRLFGKQRQPYIDIGVADWPSVTVFIPAHNEEKVISGILNQLLAADYPPERLVIVPINDHSTDTTKLILDDYAARYPERIRPYHRFYGRRGKAAALREVSTRMGGDIHLIFDADYLPGRGLIKQLVAPFFDPSVGAVMGRVVPQNLTRALLTRLLDLERSGGYQVDQQARMNLGLIPQYGGTVGGVRCTALNDVGGWRADTLAEDTDITLRMILHGWEVVYQNRSECYEEIPENWPNRIRQISRWARGHNQALFRYALPLIGKFGKLKPLIVLDGLLLLGVFMVPPILLLGWGATTALFLQGGGVAGGFLIILGIATYSTLGNFAAFFEVATAARLDGSRQRIALLPLLSLGFLVSLLAVSWATLTQIFMALFNRRPRWEKTQRFRGGPP